MTTEDFDDGELSPAERQRLRRLLTKVTFAEEEREAGPGHGGNVTLHPGLPAGGEGTLAGRIVMENPGGTSRPFLTLRGVAEGGGELDVYIGEDPPREDMGDARKGAVYLEVGGGPSGARPLKVHRRTAEGWVWARWT